MKSRIAALTLVTLVGFAPAAIQAANTTTTTKTVKKSTKKSETEADLLKEAKFTRAQAEEIALKKAPDGAKVESAEIEREHGKLVWSFDIKSSKPGVTEVLVNAIDGTVVSVTQETPKQEAKEKKQEAKEKAKKQ